MSAKRENDKADIERRVIEIVNRKWGPCTFCVVTPQTRFREDLDADSIDAIELIMEAEDEFRISIADDEAEKVRTVGDAVNLVMEILGR